MFTQDHLLVIDENQHYLRLFTWFKG